MLREQLKKYRERTGFTQDVMAALFGMKKDGYLMYERQKPSQPALDKAAGFAKRMLVSLGWLANGSTSEMWDADLLRPMRVAIRKYAFMVPIPDLSYHARICHLIRWTHSFDPEMFDAVILSGVAGVSLPAMEAILAGDDPMLGNPTPDYLADFWHLSASWLLTGSGEPAVIEIDRYAPLIHTIEEIGLSQEFLLQHDKLLRSLHDAWAKNRGSQARQA